MCVGSLAGITYLRHIVLTSSNKSETAVHCCDPALSVLAMLVSRNVSHEASASQSIVFRHIFFGCSDLLQILRREFLLVKPSREGT